MSRKSCLSYLTIFIDVNDLNMASAVHIITLGGGEDGTAISKTANS